MIGARYPRASAHQQTSDSTVIPAPAGGMDARVGAGSGDMNVALLLYNLVPAEYGLQVRSGYRVWAEGFNDEEVRTVIPYQGLDVSQADDKLFVATTDGIWDASTAGGTPTLKVAFGTQSADSGFGVYTHYVNDNGDDMVYYADGENGLFEYDTTLDTWAQATNITKDAGEPSPWAIANINYVVSHKNRLWFCQKNSNVGWYLPVAVAEGQVEPFFFARKFKHGGNLVGVYNWTMDGGDGRDDYLVAVSRGGDVIPYTGADPASAATWDATGTFFIGNIPRGTRAASEYGGNLYLLSTLGLISMTDLLAGTDPATIVERNSIGYKIARLLRNDITQYRNSNGWDIKYVPQDGAMMVTVPQLADGTYRQYVYSIATGAWGIWRDVAMISSEPYQGELMVGSEDGRLLRMDVPKDEVASDNTGGEPIKFAVLSSYTDFGAPAKFKRGVFVRPNWSAETAPSYECYALYDYSLQFNDSPPNAVGQTAALWDTALWDFSVWADDRGIPYFSLRGTSGMGRTVAISMSGYAQTDTVLLSWDIAWNTGGFL
jgi:hypothetical protein